MSVNDVKNTALLDRLGGRRIIAAIVERLYEKVLADDRLLEFFVGCDVDDLMAHQKMFMSFAFSEFPSDFNVSGLLLKRHERFFERGLCADHFDMVAGHLVDSMNELGFQQRLMEEAVGVVAKLRPIFEEGARLYGPSPIVAEPSDSAAVADNHHHNNNTKQKLEQPVVSHRRRRHRRRRPRTITPPNTES